MARRHHGEPRKRVGIFAGSERVERAVEPGFRLRELRGELLDNVGADFVTALAYARADGDENLHRARRKFHLHATKHLCGDARERAAPSSMNSGHGAMTRVDEEDGNAVGGLNGKEQSGRGRSDGIALRRVGGRFGNDMRDVGMNLAQSDERRFCAVKRGQETTAIFVDAVAAVPIGVTEV